MREALLRLAQSSPGNDAFPFALSLAQATPATTRGSGLESVSANELVVTPQVMLRVFTPIECDSIVGACARHPLHAGQLVQERENYRVAQASWIPVDSDTRWVYERIAL